MAQWGNIVNKNSTCSKLTSKKIACSKETQGLPFSTFLTILSIFVVVGVVDSMFSPSCAQNLCTWSFSIIFIVLLPRTKEIWDLWSILGTASSIYSLPLKGGCGENIDIWSLWAQNRATSVLKLDPKSMRLYTTAQELTSGAIRMLLTFFVKIWAFFKDGRVWGFFYQMNLVVNFDIFYNFWYISALDGQI